MDNLGADANYTWRELKAVVVEMMDALGITSDNLRSRLWTFLPLNLVVREIDFLRDRTREMMASGERTGYGSHDSDYFWSLLLELSSQDFTTDKVFRGIPVRHILYLGAVASPLANKFAGIGLSSPMSFNRFLAEASDFDACRLRRLSSDPIVECDLPRIRGELMEYMMLLNIAKESGHKIVARSEDPEFYAWLGQHQDEVLRIYPALKERGSAAPSLVRELVSSLSSPLVAGTL